MKKLAVTLALSLVASASAGGSGPRSEMPFVHTGQVWEMTFQPTGQKSQQKILTLKSLELHDIERQQDDRRYTFTDNPSEALFILPSVHLIGISAFQTKEQPRVMCIVDYRKNTALRGVIIVGSETEWNIYTATPESSTETALFITATRDKLGICTLKRLR